MQQLVSAGALLIGKTHTTEFAVAGAPPTRNPYDLERSPGGSSSGSGAGNALITNFFPLSLGSDTLGSMRFPSSYCGVVGLLPSTGRMSGAGVMPFSGSLDRVGVFSRRADDLRLVAPIMVEGWSLFPELENYGLKFSFFFGGGEGLLPGGDGGLGGSSEKT